MTLDLIAVPYDSGHRSVRLGRGPEALLEGGLEGCLAARGHETSVHVVEARPPVPAENAVAFDLASSIAERVADARTRGAFPVVLAGNCISVLGAVAGVSDPALSLVWLDAHGDFNTPDTSTSAFLDGMAASVVTGGCWRAAVAAVPGFTPVSDARFYLVGARDLDAEEERRLDASDARVISPAELRDGDGQARALERLAGTGSPVHLHVDLDVLDPDAVGPANGFAAPGGLVVSEIVDLIEVLATRTRLVGCTVTAYDPSCDPESLVRDAAFELLGHLADAVRAAEPL